MECSATHQCGGHCVHGHLEHEHPVRSGFAKLGVDAEHRREDGVQRIALAGLRGPDNQRNTCSTKPPPVADHQAEILRIQDTHRHVYQMQ